MITQNPKIQQSVHILVKLEQHLLHYQYNEHTGDITDFAHFLGKLVEYLEKEL